jgi:hypothetical protein
MTTTSNFMSTVGALGVSVAVSLRGLVILMSISLGVFRALWIRLGSKVDGKPPPGSDQLAKRPESGPEFGGEEFLLRGDASALSTS